MHLIVDTLSLLDDRWTPRAFETREVLQTFGLDSGQEVTALVPASAVEVIPPAVRIHTVPLAPSGPARIAFEMYGAARLAASLGGDVLLRLGESAPWRSPIPVVATAGLPQRAARGLGARMASALRRASVSGASAVLLPDDLPPRLDLPRLRRVSPLVGSPFQSEASPAPSTLDGDYVLAWIETAAGLQRLLASWTWVDASLGDSVKLKLLCPSSRWEEDAGAQIRRLGLDDSVQVVGEAGGFDLPAYYRQARALMQAGEMSSPQILRWALAAGVPVAAELSDGAASIVGPAGYLVRPSDTRALGAAALTILVEDKVAETLRERGWERARAYDARRGLNQRLDILRSLVGKGRPTGQSVRR